MLCFLEEKGGEDLKGKRRKILETGEEEHQKKGEQDGEAVHTLRDV